MLDRHLNQNILVWFEGLRSFIYLWNLLFINLYNILGEFSELRHNKVTLEGFGNHNRALFDNPLKKEICLF